MGGLLEWENVLSDRVNNHLPQTVTDQGVVVLGDLSLQQRQTLQPHNPHTVYNSSLIQDPALLQVCTDYCTSSADVSN